MKFNIIYYIIINWILNHSNILIIKETNQKNMIYIIKNINFTIFKISIILIINKK